MTNFETIRSPLKKFEDIRVLEEIKLGDITTLAQCLEVRAAVHEATIHIAEQIDRAKAEAWVSGDYAERDWFHRANKALKFHRYALQRLQEHGAKLGKQERMKLSETRNEALIRELRAVVGEDVFKDCVARAEKRLEQADAA